MNFMSTSYLFASILAIVAMNLSCSDSKFVGQQRTPKGTIPETVPKKETPSTSQTISLPCNGFATADKRVDINGTQNSTVVIDGTLCYEPLQSVSKNELVILFAVDFSGSMETNDPLVSGTCGRRRAIEAILERVRSTAQANHTNVTYGIVGFGTDARIVSPMTLLPETPWPSRTDLCAANGFTNYEAALNLAETMLAPESGRKVLYFISDGLPTVSSGAENLSDENGLAAAQSLRSSIDDLSMFAIYLTGPTGALAGNKYSDITDPKSYLSQITGSASNVKVVATAAQLATQILEFKLPDPVAVELQQPNIVLSSPGTQDRPIVLESFGKQAATAGAWAFKTKPVILNSRAGAVVKNSVRVMAKASDGVVRETVLEINFTAIP
jgi:hypothetical protein